MANFLPILFTGLTYRVIKLSFGHCESFKYVLNKEVWFRCVSILAYFQKKVVNRLI